MGISDQDKARVAEIEARCDAAQGLWGSIGNLAGFAEFARKDIPWLLSVIRRLSDGPDGPDVVFCEDCVRFKGGECNSAYGLPDPVDETDFCSYGERRKEPDDG